MEAVAKVIAHIRIVNKIQTSSDPVNPWPDLCAKAVGHIKQTLRVDSSAMHADLWQRVTVRVNFCEGCCRTYE